MERFTISAKPMAVNTVLETADLRITLLTPCLIRVEKGAFTDLPTQTVWNRDLGAIVWEAEEKDGICTVKTEEVTFYVDKKQGRICSIVRKDGTSVKDFTKDNLLGTARTLDNINGATKLGKGIISRSGAAIMDDSNSLLLGEKGKILPRPACTDLYCFAYGHDYRRQMKDFFRITGQVPLIPKHALGNWWSRYRAYTQEEYRTLMQTFIDRKLPITVATIDMDWHWTDVLQRFGNKAKPDKAKTKEEIFYNTILPGWTGYTWNTELFPDHKELLDWLHENNFHVTLNVHPSQGIRFFEECYPEVCQSMGLDATKEENIPFDITDPDFIKAYFDQVHRPLEAEGVDFWWLDWQQGTKTNIPGLDPLWALNHYHTLDQAAGEKRPLILSRYAGLGSHRYPLGFSGDTIVTWKSLHFQPYFTNTAANAGYTWWSHDIGGHMKGVQDDELYLRWLQYGVFSPINRLHSSNSHFMGKEPWKRSWAVEQVAERYLRLRHKLIPYLYSANYRTHTEGTPVCEPMYYGYDCQEAYDVPNQYIFGGQLLVVPVTAKADKRLNLSATKVWLPEGRWTDIFNGRAYKGGRWVTMYRDIDAIPVLAGEGSIVPMYRNGESNDLSLDQPLEIHIWRGNGSFALYEDDGQTNAYREGQSAVTVFTAQEAEGALTLTIQPPRDSCGLLPEKRKMYLRFRDIAQAQVRCNGEEVPFGQDICVEVGDQPVEVVLTDLHYVENPAAEELKINLLTRVQSNNLWKSKYFREEKMPKFVLDALAELDALV